MKNPIKNTRVLATVLASLALPSIAQEKIQKNTLPVSGELSISPLSKYIFRGATYSESPVTQPSLTLSHGALSGTALFNYDHKSRRLNEADAIVNASFQPAKGLNLSLGYEFLTFPNTEFRNTHGITSSFNYDTLGQPTLFFTHDFKEGKGSYGEFSLSHNIPVLRKASLIPSASLAFNDHYFRQNSGFSHISLGASLPVELKKSLTLKPSINLQRSLDKDIKNHFWGGLAVSYKF